MYEATRLRLGTLTGIPAMVSSTTALLPQAPDHRDRFAFLDVLRGLAAVAVFTQHALEKSGLQSLDRGGFGTTWLNLGETGVALFFLVSGFIIPASMRGTATMRDFWIRRALRIYPLYWFIFAVTLGLALGAGSYPDTSIARILVVHAVFASEWTRIPDYVAGSWTLFIELIWYGVFALAFFSPFGAGTRLIRCFLACFLVATLAAGVLWHDFPLGRLSIFALCFLGYGYLLHFEGTITTRSFIVIAAGFHAVIVLAMIIRFAVNTSSAPGAPSLTCVIVSWGFALALFPILCRWRDSTIARSGPLRHLGEISFSLYLVHSVVLDLLQRTPVTGLAFVALGAALTVLLSILTYRTIERPGILLARKLTRRRARPFRGAVGSIVEASPP